MIIMMKIIIIITIIIITIRTTTLDFLIHLLWLNIKCVKHGCEDTLKTMCAKSTAAVVQLYYAKWVDLPRIDEKVLASFYCCLGPKYRGILGVNARGWWNQTARSLQWAICYTVKHHLETVLYKPLCHVDSRSRAPCTVCIGWSVAVDPLSLPLLHPFTWPSL